MKEKSYIIIQIALYDLTGLVDKERVVGVYFYFSEAFKSVFCYTLVTKIMKYRLDKWAIGWPETWFNTNLQWLWSAVQFLPWGHILRPILFNILINNLDGSPECSLHGFADDKKLGGLVIRHDGCATIQRNLGELEKWANSDLM